MQFHFVAFLCLYKTETLYLYSNQLIGTIPSFASMGNSSMSRLLEFDVHENNLIGPTEQLFQHENLVRLRLDTNSFTGTLSDMIGNCPQLTYLRLERNFLEGTLPPAFASLTQLGT